jgi:hypothetical protein
VRLKESQKPVTVSRRRGDCCYVDMESSAVMSLAITLKMESIFNKYPRKEISRQGVESVTWLFLILL